MTTELAELNIRNTPQPVCPYCGAKDYDWWELSDKENEQEGECGKCGETYMMVGEAVMYWTTWKPKKKGT